MRLQKPYVIKWLLLACHKPDLLFSNSVQWITPSFRHRKRERRRWDCKLDGDLSQAIVSAAKKLVRAHKLLQFVNNLHKIRF